MAVHNRPYRKHWSGWKSREKKATRYQEQDYDKIAAYKYEIIDVSPEKIAYVDETGIDSYLCREYGYAPRGELLHDQIAGRKYARTGIVAAQMGQEILGVWKINCVNGNIV